MILNFEIHNLIQNGKTYDARESQKQFYRESDQMVKIFVI